ncbi:hypothetical protein ACLOJK_037008, partial [Asimina triloba]
MWAAVIVPRGRRRDSVAVDVKGSFDAGGDGGGSERMACGRRASGSGRGRGHCKRKAMQAGGGGGNGLQRVVVVDDSGVELASPVRWVARIIRSRRLLATTAMAMASEESTARCGLEENARG